MALAVGIDIGSVSLKLVVVGGGKESAQLAVHARENEGFKLIKNSKETFLLAPYYRINGQPVRAAKYWLDYLKENFPELKISRITLTGSGGKLVSSLLSATFINEFRTSAKAIARLHPDVLTVVEMGGENSKYILLAKNQENERDIVDYETNGDCAAGTGSFLDQQASRLKYAVEDIGDIVLGAKKKAQIAGRCSVFAKSDMIHAQQKGYQPDEILKGLCQAVARNFKSSITKGKEIVPKVAFIGGLAMNQGVCLALREAMELNEQDFIVPEYQAWAAAIGCAIFAQEGVAEEGNFKYEQLERYQSQLSYSFPKAAVLKMDKVLLLRDKIKKPSFQLNSGKSANFFLGIDIGSVSTNLVLLDKQGIVVEEIYLRTSGRPIEVVNEGLQQIKEKYGQQINILGVGTTGSGRELIGQLVGADTVNDEITAHKTGASFISETILEKKVDTIFEIGGQDSKFISLQDGVVVDFTMNEACAAGTGSFLEEQAEKLGISIKGEFARAALKSTKPIRLGERCTVFMEQDVVSYQHKGAEKEDLIAGLAYSVVLNYLNRVVRGRPIGQVVFFQGGTAYNDAVAAAFASVTGKEIIVPPYNGVVGAIGQALLAKEKYQAEKFITKFRGFDLNKVPYKIREFTCHSCSNHCDIQEFTVENVRTYWGDKCSDKYRTAAKVQRKPIIPDLISFRDKLLWDTGEPTKERRGIRLGIPRVMYFFDRFQFWNSYFKELGFDIVLSDLSNKEIVKRGLDTVVAQPCFPIQVAHGHIDNLLNKGVDFILVPNQINSETPNMKINSHVCPWGQTLAYILRQAPEYRQHSELIFIPTVEFRRTPEEVNKQLYQAVKRFGVSKREAAAACRKAYDKQNQFKEKLYRKGEESLQQLRITGEPGILITGRPYNIYDRAINLNIPAKLRSSYGVNVIPLDFLRLDEQDIDHINDNMYWNYGRKILQAAALSAKIPNLHMIYFTNFKCGPDSYIKQFASDAAVKPFLTLQFDGHGNDAGMMTRVEAYLDSKGVLRWWSKKEIKQMAVA